MSYGSIINWTPDTLARFKRAYAKALKDDVPTFTFEGNEFVVGYAKYLIEYLEGKFNDRA